MSENLGYNLDTQYADYDLKGTINERRKSTATSNKTKMDLDFIEDFESVPLCLYEDEKLRNFDYALNNDSYFLWNQNVIDYSLLILISPDTKEMAAGIIDYA